MTEIHSQVEFKHVVLSIEYLQIKRSQVLPERLNTGKTLHSRDSHFQNFTFSCFWGSCCELLLSSARKKQSS